MKYWNSVFLLLVMSVVVSADMVSMDDSELGNTAGQALFKLEENVSTTDSDITFNKLTLGLKIETNITIDEISLGTFYRQDGNTCTEAGRFCTNDTGSYTLWNCTVSECGGITADSDNDGESPFQAGALVYGDILGLTEAQKGDAAWASAVNGDPYNNNVSFSDNSIFKSGFEYTQDTDVHIRDLTMGRVIVDEITGQETLEDFIIEKPFIEFAYDNSAVASGGSSEIVGARVGFGSATGTQGNVIDVLSGFVQPVVETSIDGGVLGNATFTFAPYLGGVRTPGYIDPVKSELVAPCTPGSDVVIDLICGSVDTIEGIAEASPQAQIFPLQNITMDESPTFWISFQSQDVTYNSDTITNSDGTETEYVYETAKAGVWINLGALQVQVDGTDVSWENMESYTGVLTDTSQPLHPDNYFSASSPTNNVKYPQTNNYY
jgi:hypothetical protein